MLIFTEKNRYVKLGNPRSCMWDALEQKDEEPRGASLM